MKKRVLIIVENLPVPFDTRVWKEACSLRDAGYKVTVLCPRGKGHDRGYEVLEDVTIYRHPMTLEGVGALGYVLEYGSALFWEILYAWWIYFRHGFELIQGCNPPDDIVMVALPFKMFGVKYIFDHHDAIPELYVSKFERKDWFYRVQLWLEKLTYRFTDVVMATNGSYADLAVSRGHLDPSDVFVVRNGPDLRTFRAVEPMIERKHGKQYLVGYVGNISIQEGLDILIEVAAYIRDLGRTDIHFTCVGGGTGVPKLREMVKSKGLEEIMDFTGRIPDQDLLEILSTADVCVNPDKPCEMNNISTMIKIMEYMALSKPIVQFDVKEGRFSARDSSLYADNDNPVPSFAEKILWLLEHPEDRKRMGEFGRKRVQDALTWDHSVENLLAAYRRVFDKKVKSPLRAAKRV